MKIKSIIIFLFVGLFVSFTLSAQKAKITGVVSDEDGLPIELVIIHQKGTANGAMTNEKGQYGIDVKQGDSCTLIFSCIGYNKAQRIIPSVSGNMNVNVTMKSSSIELSGVEVKGNRIQTNTVEKLDASKIRMLADPAGGSIESLLVTYAGVSSNNELSSQYSVRGGNFDENIVYVNGTEVKRPLLIRSGQQEGLSFINPDLTAEVNFSSGGYEAKYGDKMSSVLDITYKKPRTFEGAVAASLLGGSVYIGNASGKFSQITGIRYKRGTSLLKTLDTSGDYDPTFLDLQTHLNYDFSQKLSLSFLGNISRNTYNFIPKTRDTSFGTASDAKNLTVYFDGQERDQFNTLFGAATLQYQLTDKTNLALQFSGFQSLEEETYDFSGEYWLSNIMGEDKEKADKEIIGVGRFQEHARNHLNSEVFNVSHFGSHLLESNKIQWGLEYQREIISDRIREWEARDSAGYSLPYNNETVNVYRNLFSNNDISSNRFSGYVQDTYKFRKEWGLFSLTAGLRGSYWDYNKEFILSPRASIGFIPSKNQNFTFRFATGLYYQSPFYKEFRMITSDAFGNSQVVLNQDIKSQRSIHFVLGGDYGFRSMNRPFKFSTELYYKNLSNLVPYTVDNVKIRYYGYNLATGYTTGIDMKISGEFVQGTDSWLSVSVMKAQQNINGVKVPLPTDQRYNISLYFTDYLPKNDRIQMNLKLIWADGLPFSEPGKGYEKGYFYSPGYRRVDIGMSYLLLTETDDAHNGKIGRYFKNIRIGIDAFNLLDIKNVNSYYWVSDVNDIRYPVPNYLTGRQLNVRLVAEF